MRFWHSGGAPVDPSPAIHSLPLGSSKIGRRATAFFLLLVGHGVLNAQTVIPGSGVGGVVHLIHTDRAVLDTQESRNDLPCTVTTWKPVLGFDFRFHGGYEVSVPLVELGGPGSYLVVLFRITAEGGDPVHFMQRVAVPQVGEDARGEARFNFKGTFDLGEGRYHVDWLMRDRSERFCASFWDVTASLPARDRQFISTLPPGIVVASEIDSFHIEPPVQRVSTADGLELKILINWTPVYSRSFAMQEIDTDALLSALRVITRHAAVVSVSLTLFSTQEMRVVYRQPKTRQVDFRAIGDAIRSLNPGTVHVSAIATKHPERVFLTALILEELRGDDYPDAIVFVSSRLTLEESIDEAALTEAGAPRFPIFYLAYSLYQETSYWNDAIGHAVRLFRGREYGVAQPRDLGNAVADIMSRALDAKKIRPAAAGAVEQQHPH